MIEPKKISGRPIRVVMFGGGPVLEHDVKQFLCRLEAHPEIELTGAFCQSAGQAGRDVVLDLWRRRRWLTPPLLALAGMGRLCRLLRRPMAARELDRQLARLAGRLHYVPDIHAGEVLAQVRALAPDLGLVYGSPILKPSLFEIPALGTLGIHHGQVPRYRGKKTTFWAIYHGEKAAGVTIQKLSAGLDAGAVVNSGTVAVGRRLYGRVQKELLALGLDLYLRTILQVREGTAVYRPQEGAGGKLYRDPGLGDMYRFWRRQLRRCLIGDDYCAESAAMQPGTADKL
jgi:folate-dependent phosphoribosylglycinamide formyltransferase PurN